MDRVSLAEPDPPDMKARVDADPALPNPSRLDPTHPRFRPTLRNRALAGAGWTLVVLGPPIGVATPMIPIGFVIFGAGVGLVARNSPRGRRIVRGGSALFARRFPRAYRRMPPKLRQTLAGDPD